MLFMLRMLLLLLVLWTSQALSLPSNHQLNRVSCWFCCIEPNILEIDKLPCRAKFLDLKFLFTKAGTQLGKSLRGGGIFPNNGQSAESDGVVNFFGLHCIFFRAPEV